MNIVRRDSDPHLLVFLFVYTFSDCLALAFGLDIYFSCVCWAFGRRFTYDTRTGSKLTHSMYISGYIVSTYII
jgi:hypothetical protein